MRLKKRLASISACLFAAFLLLPMSVSAAGSSTVTLQATIPATHDVQLVIQGQGALSVNATQYRQNGLIAVERLAEQEYNIKADEDWNIVSVMYAGMEQKSASDKLTQLTFTAPAINTDGQQLTVVFAEDTTPTTLPTTITELEDELDKIRAEELKEEDYTTDSWKAFEDAYKKAEEVLNNPNATQEEVDEALKNLSEARANLKKATSGQPTGQGGTVTKGPTSSSQANLKGKGVNTGDTSNLLLYGMLMVLASGTIVGLKKKREI
jgi:Uncharacterised Sugar-binding Domain.